MPRLTWDQIGERAYESGIDRVVLYKQANGAYPTGKAWNGVTALNITPEGAEPTPLYANNSKYLTLMSAEDVNYSIEAYTYPEDWNECNGFKEVAPGVLIAQQTRVAFGIAARSFIGNDTKQTNYGYKLHLLYNSLASPSEQPHATINEDPEVDPMSWECSTTPVDVDGTYTTAYICIDSTKVDPTKLAELEAILYGSDDAEARLPLPAEVISIIGSTEAAG